MEIEKRFLEVNSEYKKLGVQDGIGMKEYNACLLSFHSTSIEGSELTMDEVFKLMSTGRVAPGKELLHHDMVSDHFKALDYVSNRCISGKREIDISFLQEINRKVMKSTGGTFTNINGTYDLSDGHIREYSVRAGNSSFMKHQDVLPSLKVLVNEINDSLSKVKTTMDVHNLAHDAHFNLVSIHPFGDGNGRTSRMLMNGIQMMFNEPMTVINVKDKLEYFKALEVCRNEKTLVPIRDFLRLEHIKFLESEITRFKNEQKKPVEIIKKKSKGLGLSLII